MEQRIIIANPPNIDAIDAVFHVKGKPVWFSWGDRIFNPAGLNITAPIRAHEAVHGRRQLLQGVDSWWSAYIENPQFRLGEEIPAHQAEYAKFCEIQSATGRGRRDRRLFLHAISARLAGPLYGRMVNYEEARCLIKQGSSA